MAASDTDFPAPQLEDSYAEDRRFAQACAAGDARARAQMVTTYLPQVTRMVGRLYRQGTDIEDLVQDVFVQALSSIDKYRGEARLATWLNSIAIHMVWRKLRARPRRAREPLDGEAMHNMASVTDTPERIERTLDGQRGLLRVQQLLGCVRPAHRVAFFRCVVEGLSIRETAELTGASAASVKVRVYWARRRLLKLAKRDLFLREWLA